jgi:hypothetical protein
VASDGERGAAGVTRARAGYANGVTRARQEAVDVVCPHCRKSFAAEPIEGGRAARYLGFKCPHCHLFVPLERATGTDAAS